MSYTNTVNLIAMEGNSFPPVLARLWMLWTVIGSGTGSGRQQTEQESLNLETNNTFTLSFNRGPSYSDVSRGIGLSIQDANPTLIGRNEGWWFRSGRFEGPLPADPIEIVLAAPVVQTPDDLTAALPALPMVISPVTTVTGLTAVPQDNGRIMLTATGTTRESPLVSPVAFTYTLEFELVPSADVAAGEQEV